MELLGTADNGADLTRLRIDAYGRLRPNDALLAGAVVFALLGTARTTGVDLCVSKWVVEVLMAGGKGVV